jgi:hypothetical protein
MKKDMLSVLWEREEIPRVDAILFPNGKAVNVCLDIPKLTVKVGEEFNLNEFILQEEGNVSLICAGHGLPVTNGGTCCTGEGSWGSDGFVVHLNSKGDIVWIFFSEWSNPFIKIKETSPGIITAISSANFALVIDIENPLSMKMIPAPHLHKF